MLGRKTAALAALTAGTLGAGATAAQADTLTVNSCDALQPALDDATHETVILDGKICAANYEIARDVTFKGINGAGFSGDSGRSLTIDNDYDVTVDGFAFTNGQEGGGLEYIPFERVVNRAGEAQRVAAAPDPGDLTVTNSSFTGIVNTDMNDGDGGGLYAEVDGTLTLRGDTFKGNSADASGGGAFADLAVLGDDEPAPRADAAGLAASITGTTFEANEAGTDGSVTDVRGGGLAIEGDVQQLGNAAARAESGPDVVLTENTYTGNTVDDASPPEGEGFNISTRTGGGASFADVGVTSSRERYTSNTVGAGTFFGLSGGGAVSVDSDDKRASFSATNGAFAANEARAGDGGAFLLAGADLELIHSTVSGNTAGYGAGVARKYGSGSSLTVTIDRSIVWGNTELPQASRAAAQEGVDEVAGVEPDATRSDYCAVAPDDDRAPDAAGNICEDPKLANVATGDVHQTAASPTIDAVGPPVSSGRAANAVVAVDWERPVGDARPQGKAADMGADEVPVTPPAMPDPVKAETPVTPAATPPQGGVLPEVESAAPCTSKRFFRITLRKKQGRVYRSAKISVNGTKVKVTLRKGRPTTRLDLRKFGYQTIRIKITAKVKGGKTLTGKRTYHPCRPSLDDGKPPKL